MIDAWLGARVSLWRSIDCVAVTMICSVDGCGMVVVGRCATEECCKVFN